MTPDSAALSDLPLPPRAKVDPQDTTLHGETRSDPYAWLRDERWQEVLADPSLLDEEIRAYLESENAYTEAQLAPEAALKRDLFEELKGRIKQDDSSVPAADGAYAYYRRYATGGQYPIFCRKFHDQNDSEQILLDGDQESQGHPFFKVAACRHSPDHRTLAYALDVTGSEFHIIYFKDLQSGQLFDERLEKAQGSFVWANDGQTLYYTVLDRNHRADRVYRHRLGQDPAEDQLVYEERDPGFFLGLDKTESGAFIILSAHDHTTSELRLLDANDTQSAPQLIAQRESGVEYEVSHHGENLFVLTNVDGAIDFKIAKTPLSDLGRSAWRDFLPYREGCYVLDILTFQDFLVRLERVDGLPRIVIRHLASAAEHEITFDEAAYDLHLVQGFEFETTTLRFVYSSMTTPARIYDYDMASRERVLRKEQEIPSGHDPDAYVTRRIRAKAPDGAEVPVSLLARKDTPLDGSAPLLLYGYGAYGMAIPAAFSSNRLSLADRGFIYAIAHIRGGADKGYGWYLDGKLDKKTNTFKDFIAAGEALVEQGYCQAGRIAAHGGSAGGMLMGVIANWRPDLFKAIVAEVPFVDVLNTMCDKDLPLTPPEWPEWGNPLESEDDYRRIAGYSPYDNVSGQAYPATLVTAGLSDPRVTYWEPAKWVARLRALKRDDNLLLLKTNMTAGHAGAAGRFDKLEEVALVYSFLLKVFQLTGK